ncbi:MAG: hypothetical protein JNK79_18665 [Chitinophagaceae bacterium]|nr:hypothetical protein [Chitinophagaceae bacterium]
MKKSILTSLLFVSVVSLSLTTNAQGMAYNPKVVAPANPYHETAKKTADEMDVNINAVRDFRKSYKNASDVKWVLNENGASVYFMNDGIKMRRSYNSRGVKEYTLRYYDENRMPLDLRQRVKSNFYDHNIVIVTEVTRNDQTYYLVKMENVKEYLTVKVGEDEITVFERTGKIQ